MIQTTERSFSDFPIVTHDKKLELKEILLKIVGTAFLNRNIMSTPL